MTDYGIVSECGHGIRWDECSICTAFGPEMTPDEMLVGILQNLPNDLRSRCCRPGEPWVGQNARGLDHDHGHTDCFYMNLAADEIEALRDMVDRLTAELSRWGWGDFHYGAQPQEQRVVDLVNEARALRGASPPPPPSSP